jgi:small neutral amino acid transporter SnatA (MarC family)
MSGWGCFPLACRRGRVSIRRVVVLLVILCMFVSFLETVCGVIVTCFLDCMLAFIVSGLIKLFSSSPSCLLAPEKKKKSSLVCVTMGSLHMVSEQAQPYDFGSPGFPL